MECDVRKPGRRPADVPAFGRCPKRRRSSMAGERAFDGVLADVVRLVEKARRASARSVNAILTSTYWAIGQRIVVEEQKGEARAAYGEELVERLADVLGARFGRGFSGRNLLLMRAFYCAFSERKIPHTASAESPKRNVVQPNRKLRWRATRSRPSETTSWPPNTAPPSQTNSGSSMRSTSRDV